MKKNYQADGSYKIQIEESDTALLSLIGGKPRTVKGSYTAETAAQLNPHIVDALATATDVPYVAPPEPTISVVAQSKISEINTNSNRLAEQLGFEHDGHNFKVDPVAMSRVCVCCQSRSSSWHDDGVGERTGVRAEGHRLASWSDGGQLSRSWQGAYQGSNGHKGRQRRLLGLYRSAEEGRHSRYR